MIRYYFSSPILAGLRCVRSISRSRPAFRILLFHDIPASSLGIFEQLVAYIVKFHGVISPVEAASLLNGESPPNFQKKSHRMPCLFSFDDGFLSNFSIAETVLRPHKIKALFFVAPGLMTLTGPVQREAIIKKIFRGRGRSEQVNSETRLMNWQELDRLKQLGHVIGCHGMMHSRLSELDITALRDEVINAGDLLDAKLQQRTDWYAFAFGDIGSINAPALQVISERYRYCRSGIRGQNMAATPRLALNSDSIALEVPFAYQKLLLEGGLDFYYSARRKKFKDMLLFNMASTAL